MSEPLFNIVTFGLTKPGADRAAVAENMSRLFKTTPEKLKPYFAGGRKVIKSNVDELVAEKYRVALDKAGLVITIEEAPAVDGATDSNDTEENSRFEKYNIGELTLADAGCEMLKEDERPVVEPQVIKDTSNISLDQVGADVLKEDEREIIEPQAIDDISDISLGEVGADVLTEDELIAIEPQVIDDISDITLGEVGADILNQNEHTVVEPQAIDDISDISMADVGTSMIENRTPKPKAKIDTSAIELVD